MSAAGCDRARFAFLTFRPPLLLEQVVDVGIPAVGIAPLEFMNSKGAVCLRGYPDIDDLSSSRRVKRDVKSAKRCSIASSS